MRTVTEVINDVAEEVTNEVDYKAFYEQNLDKVNSFDAVVAKKDELLKETKKVKAERAEAQAEAARVAEEKAQKDGEFEKLWKTAKQREDELSKELQNIRMSNRQDRINNAALTIATKLADGDNVELLSDFIARNLDRLADETGALSADVAEDVEKDFANNAKYKSLMRANKSSGGSAPGNARSAGVTKEKTRQEFDSLDQKQRREFLAGGGRLTQ